jgi:hypothetical protein
MQATTATSRPMPRMSSGGMPLPASETMTVNATIVPIMTTSPWAKLISPMMP